MITSCKNNRRQIVIKIILTSEEQKELERFRSQASSKDSEKALMVLLNSEGKSPVAISRSLKRNPHTVRHWLKQYQRKGIPGLSRRYSPGRPTTKRDAVKERLNEIISSPPQSFGYMDSVWTVPLIAFDVSQNLSGPVSTGTVTRALKEMGYTYKRPSKTVPAETMTREEKETAIMGILDEIKDITHKKECVIYALDESHFSTEPYLVRGWFKKRWPPSNRHTEKKGKSDVFWMFEFKNVKILLEKVQEIR